MGVKLNDRRTGESTQFARANPVLEGDTWRHRWRMYSTRTVDASRGSTATRTTEPVDTRAHALVAAFEVLK